MGLIEAVAIGALCAVGGLTVFALIRSRRRSRRRRWAFEQLPGTSVITFDRELRVEFASGDGLLRHEGFGPGRKLIGRRLDRLMPHPQGRAIVAHCAASLKGERRSFEFESVRSERRYWLQIAPVVDGRGRVIAGTLIALDLTGTAPAAAQGRALDVFAATAATRELARSVDGSAARAAICETARATARAPVAALFEPAPDSAGLVASAAAGADLRDVSLPADGEGGAARAFSRAESVFVPAGSRESAIDRQFMRRIRAQAVLWQPVISDRAALGVLAIAWQEPVEALSVRVASLVEMLGAEAGVAISRTDLLASLERVARTDMLTGLPNRRYWDEHLTRELARALREETPLCVAMLDLDHFKAYNDQFGHQAGDRVLRSSAAAWREVLRPYDTLARYGGEEFGIILPGCSMEDAVPLIERLRELTPEGQSCSAGVVAWEPGEPSDQLVGRADAALYRAKNAGRDRIAVG